MTEFDSVIPAGGSGRLTASLRSSPLYEGRVSKSVTVTTNAPGDTAHRLVFSVELRRPVAVLPSPALRLTVIEGVDRGRRFLLRREDGRPLEVTLREVRGGHVRVLAVPAFTADPPDDRDSTAAALSPRAGAGDMWLELRPEPGLDPGSYSGEVVLATNVDEQPQLELPYSLRLRPLIDPVPQRVRLPAAAPTGGHPHSATVTLTHALGEEFAVTGIAVSHPELFTASRVGTRPRAATQTLRVDVIAAAAGSDENAVVEGWCTVETDDPRRPSLTIPVVIGDQGPRRRPVRGTDAGAPTSRF